MKTQTFTASIWREDNWFIAQCLEVDIASQGESEESALGQSNRSVGTLLRVTSTKFETSHPEI